jgi:hypothetical protein
MNNRYLNAGAGLLWWFFSLVFGAVLLVLGIVCAVMGIGSLIVAAVSMAGCEDFLEPLEIKCVNKGNKSIKDFIS